MAIFAYLDLLFFLHIMREGAGQQWKVEEPG